MILSLKYLVLVSQCFIVLLSYRVSFPPTTLRKIHRSSIGAFPLKKCPSGFLDFIFEIVPLHHPRIIDVPDVPPIKSGNEFQSQIWDLGISTFGIEDNTIRLPILIGEKKSNFAYPQSEAFANGGVGEAADRPHIPLICSSFLVLCIVSTIIYHHIHRSTMWSCPWLILLFYRVSSFPTRFRQYHRSSVGVIPLRIFLRIFLSGFQILKFETYRLHHNCVIESKISVSLLNLISQNQIWDPGISYFELGKDGMKLRLDMINQRRLLLYSMAMDSYLSVGKKFTISSEVGVLFLPLTNLDDDTVRWNNGSAKASIMYICRISVLISAVGRITLSRWFLWSAIKLRTNWLS